MTILTLLGLALALAVALAVALALAYLPMRLLLGQMARDIRQFIDRQRDRRRQARTTPDRRQTPEAHPAPEPHRREG